MSMSIYKGTALITGATSGIGAAYAERLAGRGMDLVVVARDRDRLCAIASRLTSQTGRNVEAVAADLGQAADLHRIEDMLRTDASITMLVNNAGSGATAPLVASAPDDMEAMIRLNVLALTRLALAAAPAFAARGRGTIVNIASIVALAPDMLNGVYGGTKAFVLAFTQALHRELRVSGLHIQAVLPGATRTDFWSAAGMPISHLPDDAVMTATDMVDAALSGLEQDEPVTIPSLPDVADGEAFEAARQRMVPGLSRREPAARYQTVRRATATFPAKE
jgi:short-subunit dehydrogenase